ncbi:hypothetical protein DICPUDRAFT_149700 [Dictyostelium purpureum]|uniref:RING-type domain-containing protein n=1 Tax=Dictyostelium purpureum TaxID=5786 RepID=F0ZEG0_DICPU|nr:uncharacterized protein DICPUDRAFT_149700 [Dictyostelium purpureum]EGC37705.1 hypothetical protein DICPUDRAFT_149700 [Dictyostelium purpureum]|eukprot:XP_003285809.1 hypothetical protein DICPUDRAFT_149700 [Dictyostelium purpureum]
MSNRYIDENGIEYEYEEVEVEVDEDGNEIDPPQYGSETIVIPNGTNFLDLPTTTKTYTNNYSYNNTHNIEPEEEEVEEEEEEEEEVEEEEEEGEEEEPNGEENGNNQQNYHNKQHKQHHRNSDDDDDEVEFEEDESRVDEIEPILKYNRLGHGITEILKKDSASCMAIHPKFLVLGTHWGSVTIHDFDGNEIKRYDTQNSTITEIVIDPKGDYIASCSEDGKVVINPFDKSGEQFIYNYTRPITAIALDPEFASKNTRQFVSGGKQGQLILNSKGWFRSKETIIHSGEGPIYAIKWCGIFIAWANDQGVKIYDTSTNTRIAHIPRKDGSPRGELYRCCLCWEKPNQLIIGWAKNVEVIQITEKVDMSTGSTIKIAQIMNQFQTKYWISGIAPFAEELVILGYNDATTIEGSDDPTSSSATPKVLNTSGSTSPNNITGAWNQGRVDSASKPSIHIVSRKTNSSITTDNLNVNGYQHYKATDYRLDYNTDESIFYIVCPKDVVAAKPRNLDDHLTWLMEKLKYDEALDIVEKDMKTIKSLPAARVREVGEKYIDYLLEKKDIRKAASLCPKICQRDPELWEKWIFRFLKLGGLQPLCPYIPIGNPSLSCAIYEMFLNHFLQNDPDSFLKTVTEWPSSLYNIQAIIAAVEDKHSRQPNDTIMIALAQLYTYDNNMEKTLDIYLKLKRGNVFELLNRFPNLYNSIQNKISLFIDYNQQEAIKLLVANTDKIPIPIVVNQLNDKREYLHRYLHTLFLKDAHIAHDHHEKQIQLYAEFEPTLLLSFLKNSGHYSLERALEECSKKQLYEEMVYLLGRIGNSKEALNLILDKLHRIKDAVEFVEQQKDEELWEYLIKKSMNNSSYISELLENIGSNVDPIKLIRLIPEKMEIEDLRDRLVKILSDYNLQMSLREGCREILKSDCVNLEEALVDSLRMGRVVEEQTKCATCSQPIILPRPDSPIVLYFCSHTYHSRCLKTNNDLNTSSPNSIQAQKQLPQGQQSSSHHHSNLEISFGNCPICVQSTQIKLAKNSRKLGQ